MIYMLAKWCKRKIEVTENGNVYELGDLVHEGWVEALRAMENFTPDRKIRLSTLIYVYVRNHFVDLIKRSYSLPYTYYETNIDKKGELITTLKHSHRSPILCELLEVDEDGKCPKERN